MWENPMGSPRMGNKSLTKRAITIHYNLLLPIDGAL
jgi:hypothetical protein